ncbi:hypothetical protein PN650_21800 [Parabacteroides distasonis]|nr:hypothetical protein [Parabacteroides distasonis]
MEDVRHSAASEGLSFSLPETCSEAEEREASELSSSSPSLDSPLLVWVSLTVFLSVAWPLSAALSLVDCMLSVNWSLLSVAGPEGAVGVWKRCLRSANVRKPGRRNCDSGKVSLLDWESISSLEFEVPSGSFSVTEMAACSCSLRFSFKLPIHLCYANIPPAL